MKCEDREEMRLIQNCPYEGKIEVGMDDGPSSIIVGRMSVCRVRVLSGITSRFSILYSIVSLWTSKIASGKEDRHRLEEFLQGPIHLSSFSNWTQNLNILDVLGMTLNVYIASITANTEGLVCQD
uniref:Bm12826 n=1 Tax=Brugia malayi TaxID=6279 RepID=A0A1I9G5P3_BRUMA|nr:Bm12826 [Brugia malayi]